MDAGLENLVQIFPMNQGILGVVEGNTLPFQIARVYWLVPNDSDDSRGNHAHKNLQQFMVAVTGTCMVKIHDGRESKEFSLKSGREGILLKPGLWRELTQFSKDAAILVLASAPYDERDYIRSWDEFMEWKMGK